MLGGAGPGLPAPNDFPDWPIIACAATVLAFDLVIAGQARQPRAGALAAATGVTAGFVSAFAADAAYDTSGQSGVGLAMAGVGGWAALALALIGSVAAAVRAIRADLV